MHADTDSVWLHNVICIILLLQVISPEEEAVVGPATRTPMSKPQTVEDTRDPTSARQTEGRLGYIAL